MVEAGTGWSVSGAPRVHHGNMHPKSDRLVAQGSADRWQSGQVAIATWNVERWSRLSMLASRPMRISRLEAGDEDKAGSPAGHVHSPSEEGTVKSSCSWSVCTPQEAQAGRGMRESLLKVSSSWGGSRLVCGPAKMLGVSRAPRGG